MRAVTITVTITVCCSCTKRLRRSTCGDEFAVDRGGGDKCFAVLGGVAVIVIVVDAGSGAPWITEEGEVGRTGHVHRRQRCAEQADPEQERVASVADVVDDLVF